MMFWGFISSAGVGPLIKFSNHMNSEEYIKVLEGAIFLLYVNLDIRNVMLKYTALTLSKDLLMKTTFPLRTGPGFKSH